MTLVERVPHANSGFVRIKQFSRAQLDSAYNGAHSGSAWQSGPIFVISTLVDAELPDGSGVGPQWHVSITTRGKRPKANHVKRALKALGMLAAEQDNHMPGNTAQFWLPVDKAHRVDCECKTTEELIVEPDGFTWSNSRNPAECRGCELERLLGRPCPVHKPGITEEQLRNRVLADELLRAQHGLPATVEVAVQTSSAAAQRVADEILLRRLQRAGY